MDFTSIQGYILLALSHTQFNLHLLWTIGLRQEAYGTLRQNIISGSRGK